VLTSPTATGFFIDLKLSGTTHGFGCAIKDVFISITAEPIRSNLSRFIILRFKFKYKDNNNRAI
jgi:hypothetical protein